MGSFILAIIFVVQVSVFSWINKNYYADVININYLVFIHVFIIALFIFILKKKVIKAFYVYLLYSMIVIVTGYMFVSSFPQYTYEEANEIFQKEISKSIKDIGLNREQLASKTLFLDGFYAFHTVDGGFYVMDPRDGEITKVR